jgi:succinoglycan biosynthesis transport protein ExoP
MAVTGQPDTNGHSALDVLQAAMRFWRAIRHRKIYVILAVTVAGVLGGVYFATATRIYEASASLMVTPRSADLLNANSSSNVRNDTLIPTYEQLFTRAVVLDGAIVKLQNLGPECRVDFEEVPQADWRAVLKENLSAQTLRRTNILEVTYRSKAPQAAQAVVAAVVASYLEFVEKDHQEMSDEIVSILKSELTKNNEELVSKKRMLGELKAQVGDLGLNNDDDLVHPILQRVVLINNRLAEVQQERIDLHAAQSAIRRAVAQDSDLRQHLLTLEPVLGQEILLTALGLNPNELKAAEELHQKLLGYRAKMAKFASVYGETHPERIELQQTIENVGNHLKSMRDGGMSQRGQLANDALGPLLLSMVGERLSKAVDHERELGTQYDIATNDAKQVTRELTKLNETHADVERLTSLHDTLWGRIISFDVSKNGPDVRVSPLSDPEAKQEAVAPRLAFVGAMALLGGLACGLSLVYVLDLMDDRFRSPEELKEQLGVPVLAIVRKLDTLTSGGPDALHVHTAPQSMEAEAFRTLRTTLSFSGSEMGRLAVTSAEPGDGKTTVLSNLGASFAQTGKRTLLIDADLRKPGLSTLFQFRKLGGLSEVLQSQDSMDSMCRSRIQPTGVAGLFILPCGPKPADPAELLSRERFDQLMAWADQKYDQVLIDCPPVMAASDAAIIARRTDGLMMVVQPAKNHRRLVIRAVEHLQAMEAPLLGIVANRVTNEQEDGYYGYGYGSGYGYGDDQDVSDENSTQTTPDDSSGDITSPRRAA